MREVAVRLGVKDPPTTWCDLSAYLQGRLPELETSVAANVQSSAVMFAAIESQRTGRPVALKPFIERYR